MPGSTPSRQCRRPAPSAPCSRAQAPRAGGLGAAFRVGWGGGGSRRRQAHEQGPAACGALGDAALPFGQGALPVCGVDAVCPAGKGAAEWRAGSWRVAGESGFFGAVCPSGNFTGAPGNGGTGRTPQGTEIHAISQTERALLPAKPSASSYRRKRGALQGTPHARRGKPPRRAPKTSVPRLFTTHPRLFTTYPRLFTAHSVPFTTFPHLLRPLRAVYCLSAPVSVLFAPLTAIPCLFTAAFFTSIPHLFMAYPRFYGLLRPVPRHLRPTHAICGPPTPFAAHPRHLRPIRVFCGHPALV